MNKELTELLINVQEKARTLEQEMEELKETIKSKINELQNKNIENMLGQEIYENQGKIKAYIEILHLINDSK